MDDYFVDGYNQLKLSTTRFDTGRSQHLHMSAKQSMINERLTIVTDIVSEDLDEPLLTVLKMSN